LVALMAALSMVLGNLAALAQGNVKRLLAYSAVAHAGYALLGVAADSRTGVSALVYYTATYGLTTLGAFAVVAAVENARGGSALADFAGLSRRSPLLSFSMMIFLLSLAGIPPLAGFFGKFYVFSAAAAGSPNLGLLWLVVLAVAMSAVSLYYYLQVLKQIYVAPEPDGAAAFAVSPVLVVAVVVMAGGVVVLGCLPALLLDLLAAPGH
jgi:NADH-quinone oxidoreductase subunit N